uniref:Methyl-CpG binding domain protein 3 n=2 Tax=Coturnix japonica TaxID=93934 RepID=A0A8C2YAD8_COTJA
MGVSGGGWGGLRLCVCLGGVSKGQLVPRDYIPRRDRAEGSAAPGPTGGGAWIGGGGGERNRGGGRNGERSFTAGGGGGGGGGGEKGRRATAWPGERPRAGGTAAIGGTRSGGGEGSGGPEAEEAEMERKSCSEHTDSVSVDNCVHSFPSEITGNKRSRVRSPALGINTNPSPSGKKFRSKPQLARYLGSSMDLSTFDLRTGKMLMSKMNKNRQRMRYDCSNQAKGKPDLNTALPVRQTASIFKQPVTKITNHPSNKVKSDPQKAVDQPRQLFWEKKLSGLNAFDIAEELVKTMDLPKGLQGVGPGCTDETLLSAIASALHTSTMPITGQLSAAVEKNPGVWLNTSQPLCKAFMVTDEDIRKQEELVQQVRKRLEEALMADMLAHVEEIARDGEAPTEKEGGEEEGEDEEEEEEQDHDQEMENV